MVAEGSGVPAGWYPDPLGLQQLRWWDGAAWTEFTSADEPPAPETASAATDDADDTAGAAGAAASPVIDLDEDTDAASAASDLDDDTEVADGRGGDAVVQPEPFDPVQADPFTAAEATALEFTSRRARRAYERKLALESGLPERDEQPYSTLDTNPVDIQLAGPGVATAGAAAGAGVTATPAADPVAMPEPEAVVTTEPETVIAPESDAAPVEGLEVAPAEPLPGAAHEEAEERRFSLDSVKISDDLAPPRTLIAKRTYGGAAYLLAMLPPLALLAVIAVQLVPGVTATSLIAWAVCIAAWLVGVLVAFLDDAALRRWGHERTATPLWALLTPIVYLSVRSAATRRETGHGRAVILAWVLGLVLTAVLAYLFPGALELIVPGFVAPWASMLA